MIKKCDFCGKEFETNRNSQIYCERLHPTNCFNCKKEIKVRIKKGKSNYSCNKKECKLALSKHTNLEKYGVENGSQSKEAKEKIKQTNLKKYGVEHSFQSEEVKEKIKQTNIERYGTENPRWHNEQSKLKAEQTNLEKYGHINPFGSDEIKEQIKSSNIEKYGVLWTTQSKEVKEKMKKSLIEKYGVDNPAKSKEIQEKIRQTSLEKYGAEHYMQSKKGLKKFEENIFERYGVNNLSHRGITNYDDYLNFEKFSFQTDMSITDIAKHFNLPRRQIRRKIIELGLQEHFDDLYVMSIKEDDFVNFLKKDETLNQIPYIRNDRTILGGKELDFYFPENHLAVEISPTYTHNSKAGWGNKGNGVSSVYHMNKFLDCEKQGIELLTIFDWHDWDKVLNMIKVKLQGFEEKIYARNVKYKEIGELTSELFEKFSNWHILGLPTNTKKKSTVSILEHKNEIVGLALWDEPKDSVVELKRLVFKPGVSVIGGASKLVKNYYKVRPKLNEITTFSDCDLGAGSVYKSIGFELLEKSRPVLTYYHPKYEKHIKHLSLARQGADRLLRNFPGYEPVGMGKGLPSNREIVENYGFLPIYDCGYKKWSMKIKR